MTIFPCLLCPASFKELDFNVPFWWVGDWLGLALFSSARFLSSWHLLLRSSTFSSSSFDVSFSPYSVNGVSSRVLVVHLYTTVVGDGNDHARDYTRFVVIHFMALHPLIFVLLYVLMLIAWSSIHRLVLSYLRSLGLALVGWAGISDSIGSFFPFLLYFFFFSISLFFPISPVLSFSCLICQ